jgi:hypothetical protein
MPYFTDTPDGDTVFDPRGIGPALSIVPLANPRLPNTGNWQRRHNDAVTAPRAGFEAAIVAMLRGWATYAQAHRDAYDSPIGDDGVLGPEWAAIGHAMLGLLNGDLQRLDGGTLDAFIRDTLTANGAEVDA